jgi:iron complex outermembrane receptor protein
MTPRSGAALRIFLISFTALTLAPARAQTLEEVVVSASRAAMRSFDAPAAVQTVGRETIAGAGAQVNLSEALVRVPGLTILERQNYAQDLQVSIRGFGARAAFGIRGIRLLIDGIPATTPDGQGQSSSISLTSTERIEVLRGPLALLYGNSSGGVISAFTQDAPSETTGQYQYFIGAYGLHRADYQWAGTAGSAGIVADYASFSSDGYRANGAAERRQFNTSLRFDFNAQTRVQMVFNQFDMPLAQDALGLKKEQLNDPSAAGNGALSYQTRKVVLQNQWGSSVNYRWDADHSLSTRAYYGTRDNLQYQVASASAPAGGWIGLGRAYYGVGAQYNGRGLWNDTPLQWAAGYEFDRSVERRQAGKASGGQKTSDPITRNEDNQAQNSDVFVQATAHLGEQLSLTGGLRWSNVSLSSSDLYLQDGDGTGSISYSAANPVLGLTWHAANTLNVYANYGQGFESPTLAEVAYSTVSATPATVKGSFNTGLNASNSQHFELGTKWTPAPQTRLDLALYQINTSNEIMVDTTSAGQSSYKNAPNTTRSGWELSASTWLHPQVSLHLSAAAIDAQYATTVASSTLQAGNKLPGIPQTTVFSELAWDNAPGAKGTRAALELVQAGRIYANDANTASADGHTVFNIALQQRWAVDRGMLTVYGRINNVGDERYVGSVIVNQNTTLQYYEPGLPRNWLLGLSLRLPLS